MDMLWTALSITVCLCIGYGVAHALITVLFWITRKPLWPLRLTHCTDKLVPVQAIACVFLAIGAMALANSLGMTNPSRLMVGVIEAAPGFLLRLLHLYWQRQEARTAIRTYRRGR